MMLRTNLSAEVGSEKVFTDTKHPLSRNFLLGRTLQRSRIQSKGVRSHKHEYTHNKGAHGGRSSEGGDIVVF